MTTEDLRIAKQLKLDTINSADAALLIEEYLKDKVVTDDDSFNLSLFLETGEGWRFEKVPKPTLDDLVALAIPVRLRETLKKELQVKTEKNEAALKSSEAAFNIELEEWLLTQNVTVEFKTILESRLLAKKNLG